MPASNPVIDVLEEQYLLLQQSQPALKARATSQDQQDLLRTTLEQSQDNYWRAARSMLKDCAEAAERVNAVHRCQIELERHLAHADLETVLNAVTQAVAAGSELIALVDPATLPAGVSKTSAVTSS